MAGGEFTETVQQPWPLQSKKGFWDLFPGKNPPRFLSLTADSIVSPKDSTSFLEKVNFSKILAYHTPTTKTPHCCGV
jgi:hypothetical protein